MKLLLLMITLATAGASVYFTINRHSLAASTKRIVVSDDHNREEISYTGNIRLNDEETAIDTMSGGGYLLYKKNESTLEVTTNDAGQLVYTVNGSKQPAANGQSAHPLVQEAIREMIAFGFNASGRLRQVYSKGGNEAVLTSIPLLKNDQIKQLYIEKLLDAQDLTDSARVLVIQEIGKLNSSQVRSGYLVRFTPAQLHDSTLLSEWLMVAQGLFVSQEKQQALQHIMGENIIAQQGFDQVLDIIRSVHVDTEKADMIRLLIIKDVQTTAQWAALADVVRQIRSEHERQALQQLIRDKIRAATPAP